MHQSGRQSRPCAMLLQCGRTNALQLEVKCYRCLQQGCPEDIGRKPTGRACLSRLQPCPVLVALHCLCLSCLQDQASQDSKDTAAKDTAGQNHNLIRWWISAAKTRTTKRPYKTSREHAFTKPTCIAKHHTSHRCISGHTHMRLHLVSSCCSAQETAAMQQQPCHA